AGRKKLAKGKGSGLTKEECRDLAVSMRRKRYEVRQLTAESNALYSATAEAWAEQRKFEYLVSACTVSNSTGKAYFTSVDDYLEKVNLDDAVAIQAAIEYSKLEYSLEEQNEYTRNLPENQFL